MTLERKKMAENKNLEELNRLKQDGQIDAATLDEENKKKVEDIAAGKSTIEKVEQFVSEGEVIAEAMQNQLYSNMVDPCASVGINITERLKKYFSENKVKPEDLSDEIQKQMINIRTNINRGAYALAFDARGNVDLRRSLQKAKDHGLPLPDYIENMAHDEEKKIGKDNETRRESLRLLNDEEKNIVREAIKASDDILGNLKNDKDIKELETNDVKEEYNGVVVFKNKKIKKEYDAVLYAKLRYIEDTLNKFKNLDMENMRNDDQDIHIVELWALYHDLGDINKIEDETVRRKALGIMKAVEQRFRGLAQKNIQDVNKDELAELTRFLSVEEISKKIEAVSDQYSKIEEIVEKKRDRGIDEEIREEDVNISYENQEYLILKYNILKRTINSQEKDDVNSTEHSRVLSEAKARGDRALQSSDRRNLYDEYNMISYQQTMKRHVFEQIFENGKEIPEEYRTVNGKVIPSDLMLLNYYISFARVSTADQGADYDFAVMIRDKITEKYPNIKVTYMGENAKKEDIKLGLNVREMYKLYQQEFSEYVSFKSINEMLEYANGCTDDTFKTIMEESIENPGENSFVDIESIFEDEKFYEEVLDRKNKIENGELRKRLEYEITKKGYEKLAEANDVQRYSEKERLIIDTMIAIVKWQSIDVGDGLTSQSLEDELVSRANTFLAKVLPDAFTNGKLDFDKLETEYSEYIKRAVINSHLINVEKWTDEPGKNFIDTIKLKIRNEKISENPEIAKARREEELLKKNLKMNQNKIAENKKLFEFVRLYKKTRGLDIGGDTLNALNSLENNMKQKIKNIAVNLLSDEVRDSMSDEQIQEYQEKFLAEVESEESDIELFEQKVKTARTELAKRESLDLYLKLKGDISVEDKKRVMSLYLGTKRDWEDKELDDAQKNTARVKIRMMLKRCFPEAFVGKTVDESVLLEKYNELFGENQKRPLTSTDAMYQIEENRLIGEFISEVNSDFEATRSVVKSKLAQEIVDDSNARREMISVNKRKNITFDIESAVSLINSIQDASKANTKSELTKDERIQYVKDLVTIVGLFHGKNWVKDENLTEVYVNYKYLSIDALNLSIDKLAKIFPNIKDENGNFDINALEEQYSKFVEENEVDLPAKNYNGESLIFVTTRERKAVETRRKLDGNISTEKPILEQVLEARRKVDEIKNGYEEQKDDSLYEKMYIILKKVGESVGKANIENILLASIFDIDRKKEIKARAERNYDEIELGESQVDALFIYAADKRLSQMLESFDTKPVLTSIDRIEMIQVATGAMLKRNSVKDNNLLEMSNSANKKAIEVMQRIIPNAVDENGNLLVENLLESYNVITDKFERYRVRDIDELQKKSDSSLFVALSKVIVDGKFKDTIDSKFLELITMSEIKKKDREVEVTGAEAERAFFERAEEIDISAIEEQNKVGVIESVAPPISEKEADAVVPKKVEEVVVAEIVDQNRSVVEPKIEQQVENKKVESIVVEDLNVHDSRKKDTNLPVVPKKQNIFSKILSSVKQKVNNLLGKFSSNSNESTGNDSTANGESSSGGIVVEEIKTNQTVQNPNMFGQQVNLDVKGAKEAAERAGAEEPAENIIEEK